MTTSLELNLIENIREKIATNTIFQQTMLQALANLTSNNQIKIIDAPTDIKNAFEKFLQCHLHKFTSEEIYRSVIYPSIQKYSSSQILFNSQKLLEKITKLGTDQLEIFFTKLNYEIVGNHPFMCKILDHKTVYQIRVQQFVDKIFDSDYALCFSILSFFGYFSSKYNEYNFTLNIVKDFVGKKYDFEHDLPSDLEKYRQYIFPIVFSNTNSECLLEMIRGLEKSIVYQGNRWEHLAGLDSTKKYLATLKAQITPILLNEIKNFKQDSQDFNLFGVAMGFEVLYTVRLCHSMGYDLFSERN